ncbi:class I SAM-dependent methyltransferase [Terrabacter sp. GCM10028922]|uniref:class I SAM-dependent methyltransferase n=1 Tax=Terrabacter sp. GCM10028922 TaxID=3273428 RepID=UPI0036208CE3
MALEPTWLDDAYGDAIGKLDVGLLDRCQTLASVTASVLRTERLRTGRFLDWAGGYGTLTRLMRDRGYDFVHNDPMAENMFAEGHEVADPTTDRYDLVTAFEVLEHLTHPVVSLAPLAASTDRLIATTQILPSPTPGPTDWDYYALESGQHITFYTRASLKKLAHRLGFDGVVTSSLVHLFYRGKLSPLTKAMVRRPAVSYGLGHLASLADRRHSLLMSDHDAVRARLAGESSTR